MTAARDVEVQNLLDFLGCPLRKYPANAVPEAEIRCPYDSCLSGVGVAGAGVCGDGDPRQAVCAGYRKTCPVCGGDGGWDGERATCQGCGGMGWVA